MIPANNGVALGGWPTLIHFDTTRIWVPHPSRFSKGGNTNFRLQDFRP